MLIFITCLQFVVFSLITKQTEPWTSSGLSAHPLNTLSMLLAKFDEMHVIAPVWPKGAPTVFVYMFNFLGF